MNDLIDSLTYSFKCHWFILSLLQRQKLCGSVLSRACVRCAMHATRHCSMFTGRVASVVLPSVPTATEPSEFHRHLRHLVETPSSG